MTENHPPPPFASRYIVDESGVIIGDAPCRRCGYNLRGLSAASRCPECGTPAGVSVQGPLLRYSDPNWLKTLHRGINLILWGMLVAFVVSLAGGFVFRGGFPGATEWIGILAGLVSLWGAWLLTEPDPSGVGEAEYAKAPRFVRVALLIGLASELSQAMAQSIALPPEILMVLAGVAALAGLIGIAGEFAKFLYMKLARRVPDEALANRARFLRWAYCIGLGVLLIVGVVMLVATRGGRTAPGAAPGPWVALACVGGLFMIAMLVFVVMLIFFYIRFGRMLREQSRRAEMTWGAHELSRPQPTTPASP